MTWSPVPDIADIVLLHPIAGSTEKPSNVPLLASLFSACESYYPKINESDLIKKSLHIYSYHLWQNCSHVLWASDDDVGDMTTLNPELGDDIKDLEYNQETASVDVYRKEAPK